MAITPNTDIRLLKTPFEIDNINQLTFSSLEAQTNYFANLPYISEDNCSYQRKDNIIRFPAHIDSIINYNYVMYKNENYTNKWFYAYITKMEYVNDNMTLISIETDVFQTWQFDITYKKMFVEREHVNNDTIGTHTIPENLNVGEVICEQETEDASYWNDTYYVAILSNYIIADNSTENSSDKGTQFAGSMVVHNNTVFGNQIFYFPIINTSSFTDIRYFILRTNVDGHIADIQNIFIVPNAVMPGGSSFTQHTASIKNHDFSWYTISQSLTPETFNTTITKRTSFTGFTPKNKKCFVYPYNYLFVTNNQGSNNIYKYENFDTSNCVFENQLALSIGISGRLVPKNYKGMTTNDDEALPLSKYPTCAWSSDAFINWLTQNSVNLVVNTTTSLIGAMDNITVNPTASVMTAFNTIGGLIDQFHRADLLPNIEGGQATGDVIWSASRNCFTFKEMRAKTEYLKAIDEYFSAFGYKVNSVKIPNITGRTNWNFVKTVNANIIGDIPQEDLQKLKDMLNTGVTFWHNPSTFLDYSQSNSIVT